MLKLRENLILAPTVLAIIACSGCGSRTNPATTPPSSTMTNAPAGPSPSGNGPGQQEQQASIDQFKQMMQRRAQAKPPTP